MIKKSVFGSKGEYVGYNQIKSSWGDNFEIFLGMRVWDILDIDLIPINEKSKLFLKQTHFDYTVCTKSGKPLLSIEFDGLGSGFNRNETYFGKKTKIDPSRKFKLERKLLACKFASYPLFIISKTELSNICKDDELMVVDGIIGNVLAMKKSEYDFKDIDIIFLPQNEIRDYLQMRILDIETRNELMFNPLLFYEMELYMTILNHDLFHTKIKQGGKQGKFSVGFCFLDPPDIPENYSIERINALKKTSRVGCKVIFTYNGHEYIREDWMIYIEGWGVSSLSLIQNYSKILHYKQILDLFQIKYKKWTEVKKDFFSFNEYSMNYFN